MKILHVHDHYLPCGGAEVYFSDILNELDERGHENVVLYSDKKSDDYRPSGRKEYFVGQSPAIRRGIPLLRTVRTILGDERPDVIHIHGFHGNTSPVIISAIRKNYPTVHTAHDILAFCLNRRKIHRIEGTICRQPVGLKCLTSRCLRPTREENLRHILKSLFIEGYEMRQCRRFSKIIVASEYMREELIRNGISPDRIELLYYYLNLEDSWQAGTTPPRGKMILYVGRIEKNKGIGELIDILSVMRDTEWTAVISGYGSYEGEVRKKIENEGLSDRITIKGHVSHRDLSSYYNDAAVVAVPSCYPEPFGLVGLEAMFFGRPVVAFDVGGIREWLLHDETGFLIQFPDKKQFAEKLRMLITDSALGARFGEKGREEVKRFMSKTAHIDRLIEIYNGVCGKWAGA